MQEVTVVNLTNRALRAIHARRGLVNEEVQVLNHTLLEVRIDYMIDVQRKLTLKLCLSILIGGLESVVQVVYEISEVYRADVSTLLNEPGIRQGAVSFSH